MRYIPAKVVFNDTERDLLKDYMAQWDENGKKREAIDATTEFDICTVREDDQGVRGFRIDYEAEAPNTENGNGDAPPADDGVSYVSFQGFEQYMLGRIGELVKRTEE